MKINLLKVKVKASLFQAEAQEENLAKLIGNLIYTRAKDAEQANLALRMFNADGDIEITETERQVLLSVVSELIWAYKEPLMNILENTNQKIN